MEGLNEFKDDQVLSYEEFIQLGKKLDAEQPDLWLQSINSVEADDIAILVYTSGTTGPSKGAMINHKNLLYSVNTGLEIFEAREHEEQLSFLPLCHILERSVSVMFPLKTGAVVNFAESIDTVPENIRVSPTVLLLFQEFGKVLFFNYYFNEDATFLEDIFTIYLSILVRSIKNILLRKGTTSQVKINVLDMQSVGLKNIKSF